MGSEDHEHRIGAGFGGLANGALKERFTVEHEQLLGLAKAAAGSGGKNDAGNSHGYQCTGKCTAFEA
jgi:hypothetical protein